LILIVISILTITIGFLFNFLKNENIASYLTSGVIIIPSFYAIYITNFTTIFIGLIFFLLFRIIKVKREYKIDWIEIFSYFLISSSIFLLLLSIIFNFNPNYVITVDYQFYAKLAAYINEVRFENALLDYSNTLKQVCLPYHYADIYFTGLISKIFNIHTQYSLTLVVYPILFSTIIFSIRQLFHSISLNKYNLVISVLVLFVSMFGLLFPESLLPMGIWDISLLSMPKLSYVYLCAVWIIYFVIKNDNQNIIFFTLVLSFVYTMASPVFFISSCLFILLKKRVINFEFLKLVSPLILTTIFFFTFYKLNGSANQQIVENPLLDTFTLFGIKTAINIIGKMSIQIIICSLPFIGLVFLFKENISKKIIIYLILIYCISLGMWAVVFSMHDSVQLWANAFLPFYNVILIYFVFIGIKNSNYSMKRVLFIFSLIIVCLKYNKTIPSELQNSINSENYRDKNFVYILNTKKYSDIFSKVENVYQGNTNSLFSLNDNLKIYCISTDRIKPTNKSEKAFIDKLIFNKYCELNNDKTITENKINFIVNNKINYLLIDEPIIPKDLENIFHGEYSIVDNLYCFKTNENFNNP
tara:strand:+ start:214 stop:1968 length:1755 start_codon:yes stop_codon:yes gene_type:complete